MEGPPGALTRIDGREYLYFGGTGYLGLAGRARGDPVRPARPCDATAFIRPPAARAMATTR